MQIVNGIDSLGISQVLWGHLEAAKNKDVQALLQAYTPDGFFLGTDDTEKRPISELAQYLEDSHNGWDMSRCSERMIWSHCPDGCSVDSAHFLEFITHAKYGAMRGSGVVVRSGACWKIAYYILSFSVPNAAIENSFAPVASVATVVLTSFCLTSHLYHGHRLLITCGH